MADRVDAESPESSGVAGRESEGCGDERGEYEFPKYGEHAAAGRHQIMPWWWKL